MDLTVDGLPGQNTLDGPESHAERLWRVAYPKGHVKGAPSIGTDGELAATDEPALFAHYDIPYQQGASGERRLARR